LYFPLLLAFNISKIYLPSLYCNNNINIIFSIGNDANYQTEVSTLTRILGSNKNAKTYVSGVIAGNEVLFNNYMSASALASKINDVKSKVKSSGLLVGTAETPSTFDPALISSSDFLVVNIHPYFGQVSASAAGNNLNQQFNALKSKVNGKPLIIGETGWPTAGDTNGQAVPSVQNLQSYIHQLQCQDSGLKYYFFDSYDSPWKTSGNLAVEQHWGIWNADGSSKGINVKVSC
jgi:glucan 1,3-beta-glucosidase